MHWQVEETILCIEQSYQIENLRQLNYKRLQNMKILTLCAICFAIVRISIDMHLGSGAILLSREAEALPYPGLRVLSPSKGLEKLLRGFAGTFLGRR